MRLSLIISGPFFVFVTYARCRPSRLFDTLDKIDAPLNVLAQLAHVPRRRCLLSAGAMVSFFALKPVLPECRRAGDLRDGPARPSHPRRHAPTENETPHIAVTIMSAIAFCPVGAVHRRGGAAGRFQLCRHHGRLRLHRGLFDHHRRAGLSERPGASAAKHCCARPRWFCS